jgi:hypothetical protein
MAEALESTERGGVFDGEALDVSDARFRAQGAYWTASDAVVWCVR